MAVNTILFDMGGTLEDIRYTEAAVSASLSRICSILEVEPDIFGMDDPVEFFSRMKTNFAAYKAFREDTMIEAHPAVVWKDWVFKGFSLPQEVLFRRCEELTYYWETEVIERRCREDVPETLEALKGRGIHLGIVSNTGSFTQVYRSLKAYGIADYFEEVSLSSCYGVRKPHGFIFWDTLRKMGRSAATSLYVGDTISRDVVGAKNAGFFGVVQIVSQFTSLSDGERALEETPDYLVHRIGEIPALVDGIIR